MCEQALVVRRWKMYNMIAETYKEHAMIAEGRRVVNVMKSGNSIVAKVLQKGGGYMMK